VVTGIKRMDAPTVTRTVRAEWDAEARVWVAESDDVPGLVTEAETIERLIERLQVLVPELLELNGAVADGGAIELVARLPERTIHAA
jgi:predicted RNase H-like HicB family nuclease